MIGVDEHVWRRRGANKYVNVIIDLTAVSNWTGLA